jgi:hypothetical protein
LGKDKLIYRAFDYPLRAYDPNVRYDHPLSPVVVREGSMTAAHLISQRPSYVKAILVHSRGRFTPGHSVSSLFLSLQSILD